MMRAMWFKGLLPIMLLLLFMVHSPHASASNGLATATVSLEEAVDSKTSSCEIDADSAGQAKECIDDEGHIAYCEIDAAVVQPEDDTGDDTPDDDDDDDAGDQTKDEFFGVFQRLGTSWKSILGIYRKVVGSASGRTNKGDIMAETEAEAVSVLKDMISTAAAKPGDDRIKWEFRHSPLEEFGKTLEDLCLAFIRWSLADGAKDRNNNYQSGNSGYKCRGGLNGQSDKINVSRAFRRLEKYTSWMEAAAEQYEGGIAVSARAIEKAWKAFVMRVTVDPCDRLVWWLDLGTVDLDVIQHSLPQKDILGLFVWFSHYLVFDERAQRNGIVFANAMGHLRFWSFMTMLPLELGMKLDEFMISVTPLKTKVVLFFDRPRWHKFAYGLLKGFLTRNMRRRVVMINRNAQRVVEEALGKDCIPLGFAGLDGKSDADIAEAYYTSQLPGQAYSDGR